MSFIKNLETKAITALQAAINAQIARDAAAGTADVNAATEKVAAMYTALGFDPTRLNIGFGFRLLKKEGQDKARAENKGLTLLKGFSGSYFRHTEKGGKNTCFGSLVIRKDYLDGKEDFAPVAFYSIDPKGQDPDNADMYELIEVVHNEAVENEEGEIEFVPVKLPIYRCWIIEPEVWCEAMGFVTTTHLRMGSVGAALTSKLKGAYNQLKDGVSPGTVMVFMPYEAGSFKATAEDYLKPVYGSEGERVYLELSINPAGFQLIPNSDLPKSAKFNWNDDKELNSAHKAAMLRNKEALGQAPKTVNRSKMADLNVKFKAAYPHKDVIASFNKGFMKEEAFVKLMDELFNAAKACVESGDRTGIFSSTAHLDAVVVACSPEAVASLITNKGKAETLATSKAGKAKLETREENADNSVVDC